MIRGVPVVAALLDDARPRPVVPLRAVEMVAEIHARAASFMGRKMSRALPTQILAMARSVLHEQVQIRGLSTDSSMSWLSVDVDPEDPCRIRVLCDAATLDQLDADLRNRDCPRCGGLLTFGVRHTQDECDETLVRDVLES